MSKGMLGTLPLANISGPVSSLIESLGGDDGEKILEELKRFNRKEPCWTASTQKVNVETTEDFYPKKFYQDNNFLWIDSGFVNWIVSTAESVKFGKKFSRTSFQMLTQSVTGNELLEKYPESVWSSTDFCLWLGMKLKKQSKGQRGTLLNNGYYNLFLVRGKNHRVFVVGVDWDSGDREWRVDAWPLGYRWRAGFRFFSKPPIVL